MRNGKISFLALIVAALAAGAPLSAHHGTAASYDMSKSVTVKGTVTDYKWTNPHVQLYFDVKDGQGNIVHWGGEMLSPAVLARKGLNRNTLKPGDQVTVTLSQSKVGNPVGVVGVIVVDDGRILENDTRVPKAQ